MKILTRILQVLFLAALFLTVSAVEPVLAPNPAAAGLWVGEVTLREVTHARGGTNAPTADQAQLRIILHVAADGAVRLLKDVTIAQKTGPLTPNSVILITDQTFLPTVSGVVRRGGKLVGRRIASAAYDFVGNEFQFTGGIGQNFRCEGTLALPADHVTNPFRHQFHPDHEHGFDITRAIVLRFSQPMSNVNGLDQLTADYQETITGLHKSALTTKGTFMINRITPVALLNH